MQLLNEGSIAYRPVPAKLIEHDIYLIEGFDIHDPEDEEWEFLPGTIVCVESKELSNKLVLVAKGKKGEVL